MLSQLLQPFCRVRAVNAGDRALQAADSVPKPDLILLDVMMSGMDGHTVLSRLRENFASREIPVIFVTAMNNKKQRDWQKNTR